MIPCYVGGKGMYATSITWDFKVAVILMLEESGLGWDTRFHYYQRQFPEMDTAALARLVCDPIERYDRDWPTWRAAYAAGCDEVELITRFFLERDDRFRTEAQAGIFCLDEAGFGSGINIMRFIHARKPVLGFYRHSSKQHAVNVGNFLQLGMEYPEQIKINAYQSPQEIPAMAQRWLTGLAAIHP